MVNHGSRNPQRRMLSPTKRLQVIYRMRGTNDLYQQVIDLPGFIETSGVDFQSDAQFRARVDAAFRAALIGDAAALYAWDNAHNPDATPLAETGRAGHGKEIVAVFGLGARAKALMMS